MKTLHGIGTNMQPVKDLFQLGNMKYREALWLKLTRDIWQVVFCADYPCTTVITQSAIFSVTLGGPIQTALVTTINVGSIPSTSTADGHTIAPSSATSLGSNPSSQAASSTRGTIPGASSSIGSTQSATSTPEGRSSSSLQEGLGIGVGLTLAVILLIFGILWFLRSHPVSLASHQRRHSGAQQMVEPLPSARLEPPNPTELQSHILSPIYADNEDTVQYAAPRGALDSHNLQGGRSDDAAVV